MRSDLDERIETMAAWMYEAKHLVVFTGAGISTESGLPDFRGPDGVWTRRAKGLPIERGDFSGAEPNEGHRAVADLLRLSKLSFVISQNIDNLHLKSGIPRELLAELHGNLATLRCTRCGRELDKGGAADRCSCGGTLVSSVIDFGQSLPAKDLADSFEHSQRADVFLVLGSSLVVTPAAEMPGVALRSGARLAIVNNGETPYDRVAHLRFHERIGEVLPPAVERLEELLQSS